VNFYVNVFPVHDAWCPQAVEGEDDLKDTEGGCKYIK